MIRIIMLVMFIAVFGIIKAFAQGTFEKDVIKTSAGDLEITFIGHASLMLKFGGKIIHVDPYSKLTDYTKLPKADLIFLTHDHVDHMDIAALQAIRTNTSIDSSYKKVRGESFGRDNHE